MLLIFLKCRPLINQFYPFQEDLLIHGDSVYDIIDKQVRCYKTFLVIVADDEARQERLSLESLFKLV